MKEYLKNLLIEKLINGMESGLKKEKDLNVPCFLMCPPHNLSIDSPNNPWMKELSEEDKKLDLQKAFNQWMDLYNFLASSSIVYLIPPVKGLQDQVYVANLGIIFPHLKKNIVVISNYTSPPRIEEAPHGIEFFKNLGYIVHHSPYKFEGEADLKFIKDDIYVGGYGIRSEKKTFDWMEEEFNCKIIKIKMTDDYLYHFDCMFFPINTGHIACVTSLIDKSSLKKLENIAEIHSIPKEIGYSGLTNSVILDKTWCSHSNLHDLKNTDELYDDEKNKVELINKICEKVGFEPIYFNISEFLKSGALMSCLVMHLSYTDFIYPFE